MNINKFFKLNKLLIAGLLACVFASFFVCGCGKKDDAHPAREFASLSDFDTEEADIGVASGYIFGKTVMRTLPKANVVYFDDRTELYKALIYGEIDGVADDEPIIRAILRDTDALKMMDGYLEDAEYSFIFPKNEKGKELSDLYSGYIDELRASGELAALDEKWFGNDTTNRRTTGLDELTGENGTLKMAFDKGNVPFAYMSAGSPAGYDVDLAIGFCRKYGYKLEYEEIAFDDMLRGVATEEYDFGCGAITITEERKENHYFASPDYVGGVTIVVVADDAFENEGEDVSASKEYFNRVFGESYSFELIVKGLLTTILLTVLSLLFGTPFALVAYMARKRGGFIIRSITGALMWILHGFPVVILMMMLYYKYYKPFLFGSVFAAAVALTLACAVIIYRLIIKYAAATDGGKADYDYRVENIDGKELYRRIRSEYGKLLNADITELVVRLIKMTSVAGLIAVTDLTHAFDLIRMRSFETTFPLILVAIIYFVLINVTEGIVRRILSKRDKGHNAADTF